MVCFLNYPWPDQEKNIFNSQALLKSMSTFFKWKLDVQNSPVCIWWQHPHTVPGYEVRFPEVKRNQKGYIQWKLVTYIETWKAPYQINYVNCLMQAHYQR